LFMQILLNLGILVDSVCYVYFDKWIPFIGFLVYLGILICCFLGSLILFFIRLFRTKKAKSLVFLGVLVCSCVICFLFNKFSVSERIALVFELPAIEKQIQNYRLTGKTESEKIEIYGDYIGYYWYPGFLDYYNLIIFDETDSLELIHRMSEEGFDNSEQVQKFNDAFSHGKINRIYRIKKNYYRCYRTE